LFSVWRVYFSRLYNTRSIYTFYTMQTDLDWYLINKQIFSSNYLIHITNDFLLLGRRGRDLIVVGFTTTYAISAYHHWQTWIDIWSISKFFQAIITSIILMISFYFKISVKIISILWKESLNISTNINKRDNHFPSYITGYKILRPAIVLSMWPTNSTLLGSSQLTLSIHWPCYCTVHVTNKFYSPR
jgi:hypothetical protein